MSGVMDSVIPSSDHHRTAPVVAVPVVQVIVNDVSRTFVIDRFATGVLITLVGVEVGVAIAVFVAVAVAVDARVELDVPVAAGVDVEVAVAVAEADGVLVDVGDADVTVGVHAQAIWARLSAPGMLRRPAP